VLRKFSDMEKEYIAEDGEKCVLVHFYEMDSACNGWLSSKEREVFEVATDYVKTVKPKYVKYRDGHRERYDPTKHC
jgi:hypothetical protein